MFGGKEIPESDQHQLQFFEANPKILLEAINKVIRPT